MTSRQRFYYDPNLAVDEVSTARRLRRALKPGRQGTVEWEMPAEVVWESLDVPRYPAGGYILQRFPQRRDLRETIEVPSIVGTRRFYGRLDEIKNALMPARQMRSEWGTWARPVPALEYVFVCPADRRNAGLMENAVSLGCRLHGEALFVVLDEALEQGLKSVQEWVVDAARFVIPRSARFCHFVAKRIDKYEGSFDIHWSVTLPRDMAYEIFFTA